MPRIAARPSTKSNRTWLSTLLPLERNPLDLTFDRCLRELNAIVFQLPDRATAILGIVPVSRLRDGMIERVRRELESRHWSLVINANFTIASQFQLFLFWRPLGESDGADLTVDKTHSISPPAAEEELEQEAQSLNPLGFSI